MAKDIENRLPEKEGESVEFKSHFNAAVIESLVAFANTKGGIVYIGVKDNKAVHGINIGKEAVVQWVNEIKNSNHLLSTSEVIHFHLQTFNRSWDYYPSERFGIEDLSLDKVQSAIDTANEEGRVQVRDDPYTFLLKSDLVRKDKITNAAYLLFSDKTTLLTTIELGQFQSDIVIKDSMRSQSDILTQVEDVMDFVKKHINKEVIVTEEIKNIQKWQYPLHALREIILNMIIHRDYRSSSDSIIKIFNHKIEFYNPGRLPSAITIEDLMNNRYKSTPRNKLIADFTKNIGIIEKYGSGIQRIINYFKQEALPTPIFENISEGFQVIVSDGVVEGVVESVVDKEDVILQFISRTPSISAKRMAEKLGVTERTVQRYLKRLVESKRIKRRGAARGGAWMIIKK